MEEKGGSACLTNQAIITAIFPIKEWKLYLVILDLYLPKAQEWFWGQERESAFLRHPDIQDGRKIWNNNRKIRGKVIYRSIL